MTTAIEPIEDFEEPASILQPTAPQWDYINSPLRFPAMVAGFGSGKTHAAVLRSVFGLLRNKGTLRGFYEPTYDLIRMIAYPRFEEVLQALGIPYRLRQSPINLLEVKGYGGIVFRSMDNPERIVGYEHADADVDELDTLKVENAQKAFRQIIARNRQRKPNGEPNTIGVTTTPEGFKFVYNTWKKEPREGYGIIKASTYSNPNLPDDYIQGLRDLYPEHLLQAYLEGEFVNLTSGTVYYAFDRVKLNCDIQPDKYEQIHVGMDFNVYRMAAIVFVVRNGVAFAVDEILNIRDTPDMVAALKEKYSSNSITIYPDAAGQAKSSQSATTSDHNILQQAGFRLKVDGSNPRIKDRVRSVNNALEKKLFFVNVSSCPTLADCMEQQIYNSAGLPDKTNDVDHPLDAMGYFISKQFPTQKRKLFTQSLANF